MARRIHRKTPIVTAEALNTIIESARSEKNEEIKTSILRGSRSNINGYIDSVPILLLHKSSTHQSAFDPACKNQDGVNILDFGSFKATAGKRYIVEVSAQVGIPISSSTKRAFSIVLYEGDNLLYRSSDYSEYAIRGKASGYISTRKNLKLVTDRITKDSVITVKLNCKQIGKSSANILQDGANELYIYELN